MSRSSSRLRLIEPQNWVSPPTPGVLLWRPDIVITKQIGPSALRHVVAAEDPSVRPPAVKMKIAAARSLLASLVGAREVLESRAGIAREMERHATSEQARVSAAMETYRVDAALDEVLNGTVRQLTALIEERGLR